MTHFNFYFWTLYLLAQKIISSSSIFLDSIDTFFKSFLILSSPLIVNFFLLSEMDEYTFYSEWSEGVRCR